MPNFSRTSNMRLATCHEDLQRLFNEVIKDHDCTIICGARGEKEQHLAFLSGHSKLDYPKSKHNKIPSMAVDVMPYPIDWNDRNRIFNFAAIVMGIAERLEIKIRWGGDWDRDSETKDERFVDLPHYELI